MMKVKMLQYSLINLTLSKLYQCVMKKDSPVKRKCEYCGVEVVTFVEHETNSLFLIFALILMLVFGLIAMLMVPILYLMTKNAVHRCSRCLQKLGEKKCFGLPDSFSNDIW